ncbi:MAG: hypothetical protein NTV25_10220 [Methanothrix sp.]|nr:hypothetical protein [Methanothrix sp.]
MPSALVLVPLLSAVVFIGIKQSAWVAIVFTVVEALGIVFNIFMLLQLSLQVLAIGFGLTALGGLAAILRERKFKYVHRT